MGPTQASSQDPKRGRPILVQRYIYSKEGGGGGVEKTFLWKTFEVYVTSCQQASNLEKIKARPVWP